MRTIPLRSLLLDIADLAGVEYERQLSPAQIGMLIRLTNQHLASAWTDFPWPELTSTAPYYMWPNAWDPSAALTQGTVVRMTRGGATAYYKRKTPKASGYGAGYALGSTTAAAAYGAYRIYTFATAGMAAIPAAGDVIVIGGGTNGTVIEVLTSGTNTQLVVSSATSAGASIAFTLPYYPGDTNVASAWEIASFDYYVTIPETVSQVLNCWNADPATDTYAAILDFELESDKCRIATRVPQVWLQTLSAPSVLSGVLFDASEAVTVGMIRYHDATGDCWIGISATAGVPNPSEYASVWMRVPVPALLAPIVKYMASADRLRADGKESTALARESAAARERAKLFENINHHQHQAGRFRVRR
jgi:hypothetical protein